MERRIVVLSGQVSVGKTALAKQLVERFDALHCKTSDIILKLKSDVKLERKAMQEAGESLDRSTNGEWVANGLQKLIDESENSSLMIVDSVRIENQIHSLRRYYGSRVFHVHLSANNDVLAKRYKKRNKGFAEFGDYAEVLSNPTEGKVNELANFADAVIDTDRNTESDVLIRVSAHLGLHPRTANPLVDVIVGGQFGSEGKGNVADHISPEYSVLVRTGGPNAGHKVFSKPAPLVYRHLPSGTSNAAHTKIILGPGAVINTDLLLQEIADHGVTVDRLIIDPQATIITDADIRSEEKHLDSIASTKKGVGYAMANRIMSRGNADYQLAKDVKDLKPYISKTSDVLEDAYNDNKKVLLEGTQGTGLSLFHGDYPSVTSRDTTVSAFLAESGISPKRVRKILLVIRTYPIRVGGTSGPMSKKVSYAELHRRSGIPLADLISTEKATVSNTQRRVGEFDWQQLQNSCLLNGPTDIAVTFIDYLGVANRDARRFEQLNSEAIYFVEEVERVSGASVSLISTRFHYRNIIDRRAW